MTGTATRPTRTASTPTSRMPSLAAVFGWILALVGFGIGARTIYDNSLFTHIATGRLIVVDGVPHADPYSFTAAGAPWVVQSWLVSLLYGLSEKLLGEVGLRILGGLMVAAIVALAWRLTRPARSLLPRILIVGLVMVACGPFWSPRPLLVGLVLLELALLIVLEGHDARWLIPVMWLWVNSHGSFPLGLVAIAAILAGSWLDGDKERERWWPLGWAVVGTVLGAIGPIGPKILVFPVELLGRMDVLSRVVEWQSPNFGTGFARVFLLQVIVAILALVRRPSYRSALPLVVFVAAALIGQRNIPDASLVLIPGMAVGLAGLGRLDGRERGIVPVVLGAAATLVAVVVLSGQLAEPAFDLTTYPTDGITWLAQHDMIGTDVRVATQDTVGNTLELLYGTSNKTSFDDRYDMYPIQVSRDYLALQDGAPDWQAGLDRQRVQVLMWSRTAPLAALVASSPDWRIRYQDPSVFIACRRGSGVSDCS